MYALQPLGIYALKSLQEDPRCLQRMDRMLAAIGRTRDDVRWFDRDDLADQGRIPERRHVTDADPLDLVRARRASTQDRRLGGLDGHHVQVRRVPPQRRGSAAQRGRGADAVHERGDAPPGLGPDLLP
jgi:hypothetical protein